VWVTAAEAALAAGGAVAGRSLHVLEGVNGGGKVFVNDDTHNQSSEKLEKVQCLHFSSYINGFNLISIETLGLVQFIHLKKKLAKLKT